MCWGLRERERERERERVREKERERERERERESFCDWINQSREQPRSFGVKYQKNQQRHSGPAPGHRPTRNSPQEITKSERYRLSSPSHC